VLYITIKKCTSTTQANHWKTKNSIGQQIRDPESGVVGTSTSMPKHGCSFLGVNHANKSETLQTTLIF
jgi:hypothetical protein